MTTISVLASSSKLSPRANAVLAAFVGAEADSVCYTSQAPHIARAIRTAAIKVLDGDELDLPFRQQERITDEFLQLARELEQSWPQEEDSAPREPGRQPVTHQLEGNTSPEPELQRDAPPADRFRPGDVWVSPRGYEFVVLDRYRQISRSRREIAMRYKDSNRLSWRISTLVGSDVPGFPWRRLSWGGQD